MKQKICFSHVSIDYFTSDNESLLSRRYWFSHDEKGSVLRRTKRKRLTWRGRKWRINNPQGDTVDVRAAGPPGVRRFTGGWCTRHRREADGETRCGALREWGSLRTSPDTSVPWTRESRICPTIVVPASASAAVSPRRSRNRAGSSSSRTSSRAREHANYRSVTKRSLIEHFFHVPLTFKSSIYESKLV